MFIVRGKDGGRIDETELQSYPEGHLYCVQLKAWMDRVQWDVYLVEMLGCVLSQYIYSPWSNERRIYILLNSHTDYSV